MAEDWAIDVKKYVPDADDGVIAAIVRYCGIALRSRDASLVSFTDSVETDRVRENFLKKKLALADPDSVLDAAIAAVGQRMSGDNTRNRVTVYYLLSEHFGKLGLFGAGSDAAPAALMAAPGESKRGVAATGWGDYLPLAVLVVGGLGILSMLGRHEAASPPPPPPVVAAPAIPDGAGVVASEVDGEPMVSVYFDTSKSDIDASFAAITSALRTYFTGHPGTHLQVSGYNDPRGDAALNAALSKSRAFAVRDALAGLGVTITSIALIKPADTSDDGGSYAHARRVDITVEDGPALPEDVPPVEMAAPAAAAVPAPAAPNP